MKKRMLPLAVSAAAAVSMSASAQNVDNGGLGEVLIFPSTRLRTVIPLTST